jgi:hypothetical protein
MASAARKTPSETGWGLLEGKHNEEKGQKTNMQRWLRVKNTMDYKHQDGNLMRDCGAVVDKKS